MPMAPQLGPLAWRMQGAAGSGTAVPGSSEKYKTFLEDRTGRREGRREEGGRSGVWRPGMNRLPVPGTGCSAHPAKPGERRKSGRRGKDGKNNVPAAGALQALPVAQRRCFPWPRGGPCPLPGQLPSQVSECLPCPAGSPETPSPLCPGLPGSLRACSAAVDISGRCGRGTPAVSPAGSGPGEGPHLAEPL